MAEKSAALPRPHSALQKIVIVTLLRRRIVSQTSRTGSVPAQTPPGRLILADADSRAVTT